MTKSWTRTVHYRSYGHYETVSIFVSSQVLQWLCEEVPRLALSHVQPLWYNNYYICSETDRAVPNLTYSHYKTTNLQALRLPRYWWTSTRQALSTSLKATSSVYAQTIWQHLTTRAPDKHYITYSDHKRMNLISTAQDWRKHLWKMRTTIPRQQPLWTSRDWHTLVNQKPDRCYHIYSHYDPIFQSCFCKGTDKAYKANKNSDKI